MGGQIATATFDYGLLYITEYYSYIFHTPKDTALF